MSSTSFRRFNNLGKTSTCENLFHAIYYYISCPDVGLEVQQSKQCSRCSECGHVPNEGADSN
jgi:hypothetical protein